MLGLFTDGYVIHCYSASVPVMLLMFPGEMVSFPCAACSHFGCFPAVALRERRGRGLPTAVHFLQCPEYRVVCIFYDSVYIIFFQCA
jgi:hypothetical protein